MRQFGRMRRQGADSQVITASRLGGGRVQVVDSEALALPRALSPPDGEHVARGPSRAVTARPVGPCSASPPQLRTWLRDRVETERCPASGWRVKPAVRVWREALPHGRSGRANGHQRDRLRTGAPDARLRLPDTEPRRYRPAARRPSFGAKPGRRRPAAPRKHARLQETG
jgi:hypothetical protein